MSASCAGLSEIAAPAASNSASEMPDAAPAPRATTMSAPSALNFLTVSGVAATRGSLPSVSRATAIRIATSAQLTLLVRESHIEPYQRAEHERNVTRRAAAAEQACNSADHRNDKNHERPEPVADHAADRQAEQQVDDVK